MIAMAVGVALALLALGYVLYPLLSGTKLREVGPPRSACPKCGALARAEASFCANCGEPLPRSEENDRFG